MTNIIKSNKFVSNANKFLGYKYIYAAKGGRYTVDQIKSFAKQYPSVYTNTYLTKTLKNANLDATDCSGLIYLATDKEHLLGSYQLYERAKKYGEIIPVNEAPEGATLYKKGHVAIKISDTKQIESRGVDYGVVITDIKSQKWECALLLDFIDYTPDVITDKSCKYYIKWLQRRLNEHIKAGNLKDKDGKKIVSLLDVDGIWGAKTATALLAFFRFKKWDDSNSKGYYAGTGTINALK